MELIYESPEGDLHYDNELNILKCVWHGYVGLEIFKEIVELGTKICLEKKVPMALLLDRRDLESYSSDAKNYLVNDYFKNLDETTKGYIYKVAILPPRTFAAQAKAKLFTRIIRFAAVNLPIKVFDDEYAAIDWLKIPIVKVQDGEENVEEEQEFEDTARKSIFKLFKSKKSK